MKITKQQIQELRNLTNSNVMECKRVLEETGGDIDAAVFKLKPPIDDSFYPKVLREYCVHLKLLDENSNRLDPDCSDNIGQRTKFGGLPDKLNESPHPRCEECGRLLRFIAQIDSIEHKCDSNPHSRDYMEQQFMFGDVGMIYVWFCFDCLKPHTTMECY